MVESFETICFPVIQVKPIVGSKPQVAVTLFINCFNAVIADSSGISVDEPVTLDPVTIISVESEFGRDPEIIPSIPVYTIDSVT